MEWAGIVLDIYPCNYYKQVKHYNMKKILAMASVFLFLGICAPSYAQDTTEKKGVVKKTGQGIKKGAKKGWKGTKKGAKAVGNQTAETATKGKPK